MAQYLLEIGMEEIPARFLLSISQQLSQRVEAFLKDERLEYSSIKSFASPRRLAILVNDLAEKQSDLHEKAKGPALKIAQDADGNWTKAAEGFARGQQVSVDQLIIDQLKGQAYIFADKHIPGQSSREVLTKMNTVIEADFDRRQAMIRQQIDDLAKEKNWKVDINSDLLEEVTSIVEWH